MKAASVVASVDVNRISMGEVFTYKVEVNGSEHNPEVNISPVKKIFTIVSGPSQQTNISWVNGKMTSSRTRTWSLTPNREGKLVIPALVVEVGKQTFKTKSITVYVQKGQTQQKNKDVFLTVDLDKESAYPGEQITVEYKLYTRVDMSIDKIDVPKFVGFWAEELFAATQLNYRRVQINGVRYNMAKLYTFALFPTKTGEIPLPQMEVKCNVVVKQKSQRRSFFDDPFFTRQKTVPKFIRTQKKTIRVSPFPAGKPADFTGAVGRYTLTTHVDRVSLKANDAVTLNIELKGTGNISLVQLPEILFSDNLEVFPPTTTTEKDPFRDQITGMTNWEYILIPRKTGKYTIPRIEIPYFDPNGETWERAVSLPVVLSVSPGKTTSTVSNGFRKEEVELLGSDIRYFRTKTLRWMSMNKSSTFPVIAILIYGITGILFLLPMSLKNLRSSREQTAEYRRSKRAIKLVRKKLKTTMDDPFTQVADAVYPYLKDRFLLKTDQLDPMSVQSILVNKIGEIELTNLVKILHLCDAGRYSPGANVAMENLVANTKSLLEKINTHA